MEPSFSSSPLFIQSLVTVSQEIHVTMTKDELLQLFATTFEKLFPECLLSFRLLKEESRKFDLVYANGRLKASERELFKITQRALEGLQLTDTERQHVFSQAAISEHDSYVNIFEDGKVGFCFLLCDRKNLYGMMNLEFKATTDKLESYRSASLPFVHLLVASLRNTKLMSETLVLKSYWEKLLDNANAPVVVVDRDGKIYLLNKTFEQLTGLTRQEIMGKEFLALVPSANRARLLPYVISAVRGESSTNIEMKFSRSQDEEVAHIAFNSAPIYNSMGQIEGVIFVGQDLTLVKDLQRQVIHSEKLATLGQVAAGVAHELNNPLTSISVYANYLSKKLKTVVDASDLQKIDSIVAGAERIKSFTKDLVAYARPSEDTPETLSLQQIIKRSVSFCEHVISEAKAQVTLDFDDDLPLFFGIEGQMEQVFVNLVTNACHSLGTLGGKIVITANHADDSYITVSIRDTGCGIEQSDMRKVFEPFFTTKDVGKGTGLGLSIVRNILKNHNASIEVDSETGVGTVFVITLLAAK
ncbi:MAG: PAS domain-containing protein [Deltaproteobacteria bacterium]|nr:PAS domain-containing protein [Deltaproteobacteria bacterium]MBN2674085.1 PAS domain-containing protein [Deltaproteobacteria bacterium]